MAQEYRETIKQLVLDEETFLRLTLKGQLRPAGPETDNPWKRVVVRPVLIKQTGHLQFSYFDAKQDTSKNYRGNEAQAKLDELLALPFSSILVQTTTADVHIQINKSGKALISHNKPTLNAQLPSLSHDAKKDLPLPADRPDTFLQAIGIMNEHGKVLPSMQDKFSQINEFLKLLVHTGELECIKLTPLNILDCGCGSAHLSFATYHYLNNIRHIPTSLVGIDINRSLVEKSNSLSYNLGFSTMYFQQSAIVDYVPAPAIQPDIVLALHACDTATDEALFQAIRCHTQLILSVPCCHHELHQQMQTVAPFAPVLQHGILKKRLADILTDTFRALILRIIGYKTDVIEFVSSEHTDRNLMIRAVKRPEMGHNQVVQKSLQEYHELKQFWHVTPYLEKLLCEHNLWPVP